MLAYDICYDLKQMQVFANKKDVAVFLFKDRIEIQKGSKMVTSCFKLNLAKQFVRANGTSQWFLFAHSSQISEKNSCQIGIDIDK